MNPLPVLSVIMHASVLARPFQLLVWATVQLVIIVLCCIRRLCILRGSPAPTWSLPATDSGSKVMQFRLCVVCSGRQALRTFITGPHIPVANIRAVADKELMTGMSGGFQGVFIWEAWKAALAVKAFLWQLGSRWYFRRKSRKTRH